MNPLDRRSFVKVLSAAAAPVLLPACAGGDALPFLENQTLYPRIERADPLGFVGHLQNGTEGGYEPTVTGKLPAGLAGTFYRNGPGVFSRGAERKGSIADVRQAIGKPGNIRKPRRRGASSGMYN